MGCFSAAVPFAIVLADLDRMLKGSGSAKGSLE